MVRVRRQSSNIACRLECKRESILVSCLTALFKYYIRLTTLDHDRLRYSAFETDKKLFTAGYKSWFSTLSNLSKQLQINLDNNFKPENIQLAISDYLSRKPKLLLDNQDTADFLKGLPSYNENNFTKCNADSSCKMRKPVITTEKTIILLRYLHQQWNNKNVSKKRDSSKASLDTSESNTSTKIPRLTLSIELCYIDLKYCIHVPIISEVAMIPTPQTVCYV
ncbi:hypothetical protein KUTeg_017507 [Tegillarca granosa]|uniref:DET1- and DDB1-associated protein 1 n=1 Tax=Tegillarca granosa TaxID=220873 RepID=A0ABQ9EF47_TEGGR|nr:hypothetical protein KUTeg_017507 [Tegillarca granosa]